MDQGFFSSPMCPDRNWSPPSPLFNGCRGDTSPGISSKWQDKYSKPTKATVVLKNYSSVLMEELRKMIKILAQER
jgi:hypothetical protein